MYSPTVLAFKQAHSQEQQERVTPLRDLDLDRFTYLPIRSSGGNIWVYHHPDSDSSVPGSFLLNHSQVVRIENIMVNSHNVTRDEIEHAWQTAGLPLVRRSQLPQGTRMKAKRLETEEDISAFVDEERKKSVGPSKPRTDSQERFAPRLFKGEPPNLVMDWQSIRKFCLKQGKKDPRWFLRQLVREAGPVQDIHIVKAESLDSSTEETNDDQSLVYFPAAAAHPIFAQAGWNRQRVRRGGVKVTKIGKLKAIACARGLKELEKTLHVFDPLDPLPDASTRCVGPEPPTADQTFVPWTAVLEAFDHLEKNYPPPRMSPRRSPLALVRHLIEISPGGTLAAVEATAASSSPESPRDLYLPAEEVREVLIQQGILAGPLDSNARRAKLGTELPASVAFERLEEPSAADIRAIDAFEDRVRKLRGARGLDKSLPWLGHLIDRNAIPATTTGKGSKRNVNAVERTKGQLPTPAPSVESTPEPVPPPLKRAKSSQLVTTVSNLSISSSTPSTPASSPGLASPAPSALIPPDSSTLSARETVVDAKVATAKAFELATLRRVYETAQREGGASFLALDVEFWERDQQILTEFGWSVLEFVRHPDGTVTERREDQHAIVKESQRYRNGRFAPDARDHFDFGRSIVIPSRGIYYLLHALISTLSATHPLFVVFHDPRGDLRALRQLGIDTQTEFQSDFMQYGKQKKVDQPGGGIWIVDTQRIFSAWLDRKSQIGLEKACVEVAVPTKRLHNAGNDAHYTLALLERLMDRSRRPAPDSAIIKHLDERAAIARQAKADALAQKQAKIESDAKREREEQAALKRD